jgi:nicotinamide riboside transporter PnuC
MTKKNNKLRWTAASVSITCSVIQASAVIRLQWIAWVFLMTSVLMWTYISYTEKDKARLTQQIVFILLSFVAIYNWFQHR